MATLRVTVYTLDNDTVVANVFLRSPTQSIRTRRRWILELRDITFGSYHTAIARARRISSCTGCLGVDHPSHLCPFPRMLGWNGPDAAGGPSYAADGYERRSLRPTTSSTTPSEAPTARRSRGHTSEASRSTLSSQTSTRSSNRRRNWDSPEPERERDHPRDRGRDRFDERRGSGPSQRPRRDNSRQPRGGREGPRKEFRR
ncbi:hypothetical protein K466DRAFT_607613 [Polyporus arcularius HHB13444]|uniref:Uncharacterized protein n=1 Tax=Polyporus arcularius HHB13444 TaxID=1314778 RepID=A0A5C3NKX0_9APHY|nr:hypothetical protein K466DRAFT_607613 [Polyporus arcularius HHB13444]